MVLHVLYTVIEQNRTRVEALTWSPFQSINFSVFAGLHLLELELNRLPIEVSANCVRPSIEAPGKMYSHNYG